MNARCWGRSFALLSVVAVVWSQVASAVDPDTKQSKDVKQLNQQEATRAFKEFVEPNPRDNQVIVGGWYLGVFGSYTTKGLLLTEVYPNTPAARVGLEAGDRILTVSGYQIGDVGNYQLRIDRALQLRATPQGWVRLLVQDRRSKSLTNVDVQLVRGRAHF